ncbi:MAG: DUF4389 domain-containing protein [Gammaproteobacteria bacterium]|nr:MAG: DUF4389 domain-containing protein [Gammaproteobacteria bacterium]
MNQDTKANLLNVDTWIRLVYMILFAVLLVIARIVILAVALLQFILVLVTGKVNPQLLELGQGVAKWALQAFLFLTYNSEEKPYPFADWPETEVLMTETDVSISTPETEVAANSSDDVPSFVSPQSSAIEDELEQGERKV